MRDAMQAILGLDLPALLAKLAEHPGERARLAERAIGARTKDLAAPAAPIVAGGVAPARA